MLCKNHVNPSMDLKKPVHQTREAAPEKENSTAESFLDQVQKPEKEGREIN